MQLGFDRFDFGGNLLVIPEDASESEFNEMIEWVQRPAPGFKLQYWIRQ